MFRQTAHFSPDGSREAKKDAGAKKEKKNTLLKKGPVALKKVLRLRSIRGERILQGGETPEKGRTSYTEKTPKIGRATKPRGFSLCLQLPGTRKKKEAITGEKEWGSSLFSVAGD